MSIQTSYQISGMTCGHCVGAVTSELTALPGVTGVEIDLGAGTAVVTSASELAVDDVKNAVDEAGYVLAGVNG